MRNARVSSAESESVAKSKGVCPSSTHANMFALCSTTNSRTTSVLQRDAARSNAEFSPFITCFNIKTHDQQLPHNVQIRSYLASKQECCQPVFSGRQSIRAEIQQEMNDFESPMKQRNQQRSKSVSVHNFQETLVVIKQHFDD